MLPAMLPHFLYLHGFASGPASEKGLALGRRLTGRVASYGIPDLEGGDFLHLTMDGILERAVMAIHHLPADGQPVILVGSSLGGYSAALLATRSQLPPRVQGLLLIAPAFGFTTRWAGLLGENGLEEWRRDGQRLFHHHARNQDEWLSTDFLASCTTLPDLPGPTAIPTVIVHGRQDETVAWHLSQAYADQNERSDLHLVQGDHRLTEPRHEALITWCAGELIDRIVNL